MTRGDLPPPANGLACGLSENAIKLYQLYLDSCKERKMKKENFLVLSTGKPLVLLENIPALPSPNHKMILDWYASEYGFERNLLSGFFCGEGIDCAQMKYEDFHA